MGRRPRMDAAGLTHHVVATGNGRRRIVRDDIDRRRLLSTLGHVAADCHWECQAYCLLDTHLHLVVLTHEATLATGMRRLLGGHARRFNERHAHEGHVWTQRYYSKVIDTEAYLSGGVRIRRPQPCPRRDLRTPERVAMEQLPLDRGTEVHRGRPRRRHAARHSAPGRAPRERAMGRVGRPRAHDSVARAPGLNSGVRLKSDT